MYYLLGARIALKTPVCGLIMDIFFIGLILWVFASYIFAELLPAFIELSIYLIRYVLMCVWEATKLTFSLAGWLAANGAKGTAWVFSQAWLFITILSEEWCNDPRAEEDDQKFIDNEEDTYPNDYDQALMLLGLAEPFSLGDLKQVYRQAMKTAHTDIGGTIEEAQALNAARDLVMKMKGWK